MATTYEIRYSTEQGKWQFWDDEIGQFNANPPKIYEGTVGPNLIVFNADTPYTGASIGVGGEGADVYRITSSLSQTVFIADDLADEGNYNVLRFDDDIVLESMDYDRDVVEPDKITFTVRLSETATIQVVVSVISKLRFQFGLADSPLYTFTEFDARFASFLYTPADAVITPPFTAFELLTSTVATLSPLAVGEALLATDADGDDITYSLSPEAPSGFAITSEGQLTFTGVASELTQTYYIFDVVVTSIGADRTLTEVVQSVTVHVVSGFLELGTDEGEVLDFSARQAPLVVEAGDGSDTIKLGSGDDVVTPGPGNDKVDLSAGGKDEVRVVVSLTGTLVDGGDIITGFTLKEDVLHFVPRIGDEGMSAIDFLQAAKGPNGIAMDFDDILVVSPALVYDEARVGSVTGVDFHFASSSTFADGMGLGSGVMRIEFATPMSPDAFLEAIGGIENFHSGRFSIIDLTIAIPGLFGAGSFVYGSVVAEYDAVFDAISDNLALRVNDDGSTTPLALGDPIAASDANGDAITYSLSGSPVDYQIDATTGQISYVGDKVAEDEFGTTTSLIVLATSTGRSGEAFSVPQVVVVEVLDVIRPLKINSDMTVAPIAAALAAGEDLKYWDVSQVTRFFRTFKDAIEFNQEINGWDVSNANNMQGMFSEAQAFNQYIGGLDVSSVTEFSFMFNAALAFNQDLGAWDVSQATDLTRMFNLAIDFDQDLGSWDIESVTVATDMFTNSGMSVANLDSTLRGFAKIDIASGETNIHSDVSFGFSNLTFSAATTVQYMIDTYNWFFSEPTTLDASAWAGLNAEADNFTNTNADVMHLHGLGGDDTLIGGAHSESFYGGAGDDTLTGNGGADIFVYQYDNAGHDIITDFNSGEGDVIDISHSLQGTVTSANISDYVDFAASTAGPEGVTFSVRTFGASDTMDGVNGDGVDYSFTVLGLDFASVDLAAMVDAGSLDIV